MPIIDPFDKPETGGIIDPFESNTAPAEAAPPNFSGQAKGQSTQANKPTDWLKAAGDVALGVPETALGAITGTAASLIGMGGEVMAPALGADVQTGKDFRNYLQDTYSYKPYSQSGQGALNVVGKIGGALMAPSTALRAYTEKKLGPEAGRMVGLPAEALNMALLAKGPEYAKSGAEAIARTIPADMPRNIATKVLKPSLAKDWTRQNTNLAGDVPPGYSTPAEAAYENTKRNRAMDTIVSEIPKPLDKGAMRANQLRHDTGNMIGALLKDAQPVELGSVYDSMRRAGYKAAESEANPIAARAEVDAMVQELQAGHGDTMAAKTAHEMKQKTQYGQRGNYGKYTPALEDVVDKAKAQALNNQLRTNIPEYQGLNQQYDNYRNAQQVLEKAGPRIANNTNDVGKVVRALKGGGIGGAIGGAIGGVPGAAIGSALGYTADTLINGPKGRLMRADALNRLRTWGNAPEPLPGPYQGYKGGPVRPGDGPVPDISGVYQGKAYPELPAPAPKLIGQETGFTSQGGAYGAPPPTRPAPLALPDATAARAQEYVSVWEKLLNSSEAQNPAFLKHLNDQLSEIDPRPQYEPLRKATASVPTSQRTAIDKIIRQEIQDRLNKYPDVPEAKTYPDYGNMPRTTPKQSTIQAAKEAQDKYSKPRRKKWGGNAE
jgi:hypothetical protein